MTLSCPHHGPALQPIPGGQMPKSSLVAALNAALSARSGRPVAVADLPAAADPAGEDLLLAALRNSATDCDQIMQRRIGASPDGSP